MLFAGKDRKKMVQEEKSLSPIVHVAGELLADLLYGIFHDSLVIAQLQEDQYIGIVDLPEAGQGVPVETYKENIYHQLGDYRFIASDTDRANLWIPPYSNTTQVMD